MSGRLRFSGSANLEQAIDWVIERMKADGLDNVRGEPVMVPRWVRGNESAELIEPRKQNLPMLGLGGSIATPQGGITAEVLVVSSFEELAQRAADARDKIVLFNAPFTSYGATVQYRSGGAVAAGRRPRTAPRRRRPVGGRVRGRRVDGCGSSPLTRGDQPKIEVWLSS